MGVTSRDVARRAGVGQATVSRVLNNDANVSAETRERVLAVAKAMNYAPKSAARTMKTGLTGAIGVVISRLTNPFYPELLDAVGQAVVDAGFRVMVWNGETGGEADAAAALRGGSVDALILTTTTADSAALWREFDADAPIVLINRAVEELPFTQVAAEDRAGAADVAKFFVQHGRSQAAVITGPRVPSTTVEREDGFIHALSEDGVHIELRRVMRVPEVSHDGGRVAMLALLDQPHPPTAVFCVADLLAAGAFDAARERNIAVPDELWIAGFDDIALAAWGGYRLTTVRQPVQELAHRGVAAAVARLRGQNGSAAVLRVPTKFIVRDSARP
jgi:LacI family transcriptional regulator